MATDKELKQTTDAILDGQEPLGAYFEKVLHEMVNTTPPTDGLRSAFQDRVNEWMMACFGAEITADKMERNHRFLEESLELVQSCGCTVSEAHRLVDYVFNRPIGEPAQECGGVMVTLAALCIANNLDMDAASETELARVWQKIEKIRAKQAAKPKHSPLPEHTNTIASQAEKLRVMREALEFVKLDLENCDWRCQTCNTDYGMKETDIYMQVTAALADKE